MIWKKMSTGSKLGSIVFSILTCEKGVATGAPRHPPCASEREESVPLEPNLLRRANIGKSNLPDGGTPQVRRKPLKVKVRSGGADCRTARKAPGATFSGRGRVARPQWRGTVRARWVRLLKVEEATVRPAGQGNLSFTAVGR
jgi:hypothetical protein